MAIKAEAKEELLEALKEGATIEGACAWAGIAERTYYRWCKTDPEWAELSERAMNFAEVILLRQLKRAAEDKMGDWRGTAWILERRWRKRWGARQEVELNHNQANDGGAAMVMTMILQTDERVKQLEKEKESDNEDV
jgi:hypothetical protein